MARMWSSLLAFMGQKLSPGSLAEKLASSSKAGNIGIVGHAVYILHIAHIQRRSGNTVNGDLYAGNDDIGIVIQYRGLIGLVVTTYL